MPKAGSASETVTSGLDLLVHECLDLMGTRVSDDDEAAIVADESHQLGVGDDAWEFLKDWRLGRVVEMTLDLVAGLAAQLPHDAVEDAQNIEVFAARGHRVLEGLDQTFARVLDGLHWIGNDKGAERGPADDHVFPGLPDDLDVSAHGHEAAEQAAERDDETNDNRQLRDSPSSPAPNPLKRLFLARA
jgi:hypothetical protein